LALEGEIAAKAGNFKEAQQRYERSFALRDSLFDTEVFEQSRALQEKFKSDLLQEENDQMASYLRWNRVVAILATVLALAIAGIAAYRVYVSRLKSRLRASEVLRLEHEAQMLGENVQLKEEIISQQKSQLISSALETSQWMEKFQTLAAKADSMGIESLRDDIEAAAAQDKHWSVFIERFRQLNPNFMEMLSVRFPELTKGELEFCSMARMNLSFKEIAHLLNISHQSVHMKKYRITKKMNLEADDDFYTLLRSL
jgi:DNA-binding CsgD family transcriptional regulator